MAKMIDPPSGWMYGFPKEIPQEVLKCGFKDVLEWLVSNGYPKEKIEQFKDKNGEYPFFHYRIIHKDVEDVEEQKKPDDTKFRPLTRKEMFFGMPKKNPKALNLDAVRKSENMVTIGFKCKPELKLMLAENAKKEGLKLSNYVAKILEKKFFMLENKDNGFEELFKNAPKMPLKTLEQHNFEMFQKFNNWNPSNTAPVKNGIACPKCGEELLDSNPSVTLTSFPAQKNTHCEKCNYSGYRIA